MAMKSSRAVLQNLIRISVQRNNFFSTKFGGKRPPVSRKAISRTAPPAPAQDPWVEVLDKGSGQIYYWNTQTNETTSLGAPKPTAGAQGQQVVNYQEPQGSVMGSIGSMVAQGMAFGVGSSLAHHAVGSLFGGGHHSEPPADIGGGGGFGGDDEEYDI